MLLKDTQSFISKGMSEKDAKLKAYATLMENVAMAGAGGAFSGGLMGGAATAISKISHGAVEPGRNLFEPRTKAFENLTT